MNQQKVWQDFSTLPDEAQKQVADFIQFLHTRYAESRTKRAKPATELAEEPFVGMWSGRDDMQDSSAWVHSTRETEWASPHE
jgi:hypothetical protein